MTAPPLIGPYPSHSPHGFVKIRFTCSIKPINSFHTEKV